MIDDMGNPHAPALIPNAMTYMKLFPAIAVVAHTAFVILVAIVVASIGGESVILWNLLMVLGFPASMLAAPLFTSIETWSQSQFGTMWTFTVVYGAFFGVVGGVQYYCLLKMLVFLIHRAHNRE